MSAKSSKSLVKAVRRVDQATIVEVVGEIDLNESLEFQRVLLALMDENPDRIVIDLSGVSYMDSSGVASLIKLLSRARKAKTSLYLVGMVERVRSISEITRLDSVFDICGSVEEALT